LRNYFPFLRVKIKDKISNNEDRKLLNMTNLKLPSFGLAISIAITFGFSEVALSQSDSSLCKDINQIRTSARQLEKINGNSSLGELKEMQRDIFATLGELGLLKEAGKIGIDEIREKAQNIDRVVKDIDDDSTLSEVVGKIIGEVIEIDSVSNLLGSLSECNFES